MNKFACKSCGGEVEPPKIEPPMIPSAARGEYRIHITYSCPSCPAEYRTTYTGQVLIDAKRN